VSTESLYYIIYIIIGKYYFFIDCTVFCSTLVDQHCWIIIIIKALQPLHIPSNTRVDNITTIGGSRNIMLAVVLSSADGLNLCCPTKLVIMIIIIVLIITLYDPNDRCENATDLSVILCVVYYTYTLTRWFGQRPSPRRTHTSPIIK
jgi:hypothetical protein